MNSYGKLWNQHLNLAHALSNFDLDDGKAPCENAPEALKLVPNLLEMALIQTASGGCVFPHIQNDICANFTRCCWRKWFVSLYFHCYSICYRELHCIHQIRRTGTFVSETQRHESVLHVYHGSKTNHSFMQESHNLAFLSVVGQELKVMACWAVGFCL